MKIIVNDFINGEGAKFIITATTEAERVLLTAISDSDYALETGEEASEFILTLPVSN